MAERDDEVEVDEGVRAGVEVPDEAPPWLRKSLTKANLQAAKERVAKLEARRESAEERQRREAAERERDEVKAELERAGKPSEELRLDAAFSLAIAELGIPNPREFYDSFRPGARFDERGRIVVETEDRGAVSLVAAIPPRAWDRMGSPGSGGRAPAPLPSGWTMPGATRTAAEPDGLGSQKAWGSMTEEQKRAYSDRVIREAKQREGKL